MNPRTTAILAVVVALIGGLLWLERNDWSPARQDAEQAAKHVFPGVAAEAVDAISLATDGGGRARLERHEGAWRLVEPVAAPADAMAADAAANALASLASDAVYDQPEPLASYGLDHDPDVTFQVGTDEHALRIGNKSPVGSDSYVTDAAAAKVYAVPTFSLNPLHKSLTALRDARVVVFDRDAVDGIAVEWKGGGVTLAKKDGAWKLVAPLAADADADAVASLLSDASFLRAEGFRDDADAAAAEFGTPSLTVRLETDGKPVASFEAGSLQPAGHRIVRGRDGRYFQVAAARLDEFPHRVAAYRDRTLARFDAAAAQRFELVFQGPGDAGPTRIEGQRGADGGFLVGPEPMAPGKASGLLAAAGRLVADDVIAEELGAQELAALGLAPPRARLRVFGAGEGDAAPLLADVRLGAPGRDGGLPAQRGDDATVFHLPGTLAEHVPLDLAAYRSRFAAKEAPAAAPPPPAAGSGAPAPAKKPAG